MDSTYTVIVGAVLAIILVGLILAPIFIRRKRNQRLHDKFGTEYEHTLQTLGNEKKTQTALEERQQHVKGLDLRALTSSERARYVADWAGVQSKFVDTPSQAILDADRLIMEVMQLRNYPVSDFEQRAADISVSYPSLVSNYRAARAISIKNQEHQANTEELRLAMIHYHSLFNELLEIETAPVSA